jgi:hypothetical protein
MTRSLATLSAWHLAISRLVPKSLLPITDESTGTSIFERPESGTNRLLDSAAGRDHADSVLDRPGLPLKVTNELSVASHLGQRISIVVAPVAND